MTASEVKEEDYQIPTKDRDDLSESSILFDFSPDDLFVSEGGGDRSGDRSSSSAPVKNQWFACILWDSQVAQELESHEDWKCKLHTTLYFGRLMSLRLRGNEELGDTRHWAGVEAMDWKRPFIVVDIISGEFGTCGVHPCLRVREINTINSRLTTGKPGIWDLVIFNECQPLAAEMVRRFNDDGVKTTVVIWAAYKSVYEKPLVDGEDRVRGEIFLRGAKNKEDTLSVLIYHREYIGKERRYRILEARNDSELWSGFQDDKVGCSWFCYSSSGGINKENQLALHVIKKGTNRGAGGYVHVDDVEEENECDLTVQSFPNCTFNSTFTTAESLNDTKMDEDTGAESQYNFTELLDELQ